MVGANVKQPFVPAHVEPSDGLRHQDGTQLVPKSERKKSKSKKTLAFRKEEIHNIRLKFPTKIPVMVGRFSREQNLPYLDKSKFLVPQEVTMSQFVSIIRNRLEVGPTQAFYILVNNKSMVSLSKTLAEVYNDHKDPDGFLYVTYASQEVFG